MFTLPPRRQRIKKVYPRKGLSPSFAKATAGARAIRTGTRRRKRRNSANEIGRKSMAFPRRKSDAHGLVVKIAAGRGGIHFDYGNKDV
jgi:hypothetical protein